MNNLCFATAFFHAEGNAPNLNDSVNKFDKYYRCIIVLFASIRRNYLHEDCVIFTDQYLPKIYDDYLEKYNIKVSILKEDDVCYVNSFNNKFPGCLYTLDVILNFSDRFPNKNLVLLDSDIVSLYADSNIFKQLHNKFSGIKINYPIDKKTNGYTILELNNILNNYTSIQHNVHNFNYYGGEFYFIPNSKFKILTYELNEFVQFAKKNRYDSFTEEHILSIILNKLNNDINVITSIIKRVWNTDTYHNIDGYENLYSFLHLPAEKNKLFLYIFHLLTNNKDYLNNINDSELEQLVLSPIVRRAKPSIKRKISILLKKIVLWTRSI